MRSFLRFSVASGAVAALGLVVAASGLAQHHESGVSTNNPVARRVVPPRAGGRYKSHIVTNDNNKQSQTTRLLLDVRATDGSLRRFQTWAPGVIKVSYFPNGRATVAGSSVSVVQPPQLVLYETPCNHGCDGPPPAETVKKYGSNICSGVYNLPDRLTFSVNCQSLSIDKQTLAVTFVASLPPRTALLTEAAAPTAGPRPEPGGVAVRFHLAPDERLYATGSHALLDRRGYRLELRKQTDSGSHNAEKSPAAALPLVLSTWGYLLFFSNDASGHLDLGKTDKNILEYSAEALTSLSYFVITGRDEAEILDRYTALTGQQLLPPR